MKKSQFIKGLAICMVIVAGMFVMAAFTSQNHTVTPQRYDLHNIEIFASEHDCEALQGAFDMADGYNNVDLMTYINSKIQEADCY